MTDRDSTRGANCAKLAGHRRPMLKVCFTSVSQVVVVTKNLMLERSLIPLF